MWVWWVSCAVPVESDVDTDVPVVAEPEVSPGVDKTTFVRLMNHVWDRYGADLGNGVDARVPPSNPVAVVTDFPTGANTGYVDLFDPGTYVIGISDDAGPLYSVEGVTVGAGGYYTVDVFGVAGYGIVNAQFLSDDLSLPSTGSARVRLLHTATGVPAFDLWSEGGRVADDLGYGAISDGFEVPIGDVSFGFDLTQDGVADVTCAGTLTPANFLADTPPVLHAVVAPSPTTYLSAMYLYIIGGANQPTAQTPIIAPCRLGP
jgi:hypothetical protein